jgi:hypothetical protein
MPRVRLLPISIEGDVLDGPQTNDTELQDCRIAGLRDCGIEEGRESESQSERLALLTLSCQLVLAAAGAVLRDLRSATRSARGSVTRKTPRAKPSCGVANI